MLKEGTGFPEDGRVAGGARVPAPNGKCSWPTWGSMAGGCCHGGWLLSGGPFPHASVPRQNGRHMLSHHAAEEMKVFVGPDVRS